MDLRTKRLILIRHGEVERAAKGRFVGRTDLALSETGRARAASLGPSLGRVLPAAFFASPLLRARQSAELALASRAHTVCFDPRLSEIDFGRWDGQTFEAVQSADPDLVQRWVEKESSFRFPEGESVEGFALRVAAAARDLLSVDAAVVVFFTHAGVIRLLLCHLLGIDASVQRSFEIAHATLTILEQSAGRFVLRGLNLHEIPPRFFEESSWQT